MEICRARNAYLLKKPNFRQFYPFIFLSGQWELMLPTAHRTVRTGPYTAPHDYLNLQNFFFWQNSSLATSENKIRQFCCLPCATLICSLYVVLHFKFAQYTFIQILLKFLYKLSHRGWVRMSLQL